MQHSQIIQALEKLIPQGVVDGPENTLLKYANESNLAPAQLEKMAQMYNVAMTLNFMDKSANRGASFRVIDVEDLLSRFTDSTPGASAQIPDEWAAWLGDSKPMAKAASTIKEADSIGDILNAPLGIAKQASEFTIEEEGQLYPAAKVEGFWASLYKEASDKFEQEAIEQLIDDAKTDFRKAAQEIENMLRTGADFSELETEARAIQGEQGIKTASALSNYFGQRKLAHTRLDQNQPVPSIIRDRWNAEGWFKKASEALQVLQAAQEYKAFFAKEAGKNKKVLHSFGDLSTEEEEENYDEADADFTDDTIPTLGETARDMGPKRPKGPSGSRPIPEKPSKSEPKSETPASDKKPTPAPSGSGFGEGRRVPYGGVSTGKSKLDLSNLFYEKSDPKKEEKEEKEQEDQVKQLMDLLGDATSSAKQLTSLETYTGPDFQKKLESIMPKKNKMQMAIDGGVAETQQVTNLQRLMLSDPIISKADPNMVLQLANTLSRGSSQLASDPNLMRMALREAIQYEAIPMHTYKDLVDMEDKRQSGITKKETNNDAQYRL
jgi:hypothetical protein